jgi:hypothetical protein
VRRGFRVAAWTLLLLAVLAVAVIVSIGALQAHGTRDFNHWVGLATVAAVPLAACGIMLMVWGKINASGARLTTGDNGQDLPERQRLDRDQPRTPADLRASHDGPDLRGPDRSGDTLPARNPTFTGRAEKLEELEMLIREWAPAGQAAAPGGALAEPGKGVTGGLSGGG